MLATPRVIVNVKIFLLAMLSAETFVSSCPQTLGFQMRGFFAAMKMAATGVEKTEVRPPVPPR